MFPLFPAKRPPLEQVKSPADADLFRRQLAIFSIIDLGKDTRDAILWRDALYANARKAGIDITPYVAEVIALSSNENHYGWGSTQEILKGRS